MKKNFVKKLILGTLTTAMLIGALTGCQKATTKSSDKASADSNTAQSESASSTEVKGKVTTVYAATGGAPKPFTYVDDNNNLTGQNIELLKAVFKKLPQYKLKIEKTDFPSIFAGLDSDRYQIGVNNFAMNDERKQKYLFSDPMFEDKYVAIVASNDTKFDNISNFTDLAGLSFIGQTGINSTTAIENFNKENPSKQIKVNYTEEDLVPQLQDIEAGKYDFLIIDKPMYEYYNKEYKFKLKEVEFSDEVAKSLTAEPYSYFLISKGNEQLQKDINGALKTVIAEGTSKKINEKYFGEDYTPDTK
jgi:polar amino acid transport system substrate-binding protein